jgi:hypothetical protein
MAIANTALSRDNEKPETIVEKLAIKSEEEFWAFPPSTPLLMERGGQFYYL